MSKFEISVSVEDIRRKSKWERQEYLNELSHILNIDSQEDELAEISELYFDCFTRSMPQVHAAEVRRLLRTGYTLEQIKHGLLLAAGAPQPSWRYAAACIKNNNKRRVKRSAADQVNAQRYEQRNNDLTGAFAQFTPEDLAEMMKDE